MLETIYKIQDAIYPVMSPWNCNKLPDVAIDLNEEMRDRVTKVVDILSEYNEKDGKL